jgi:hypothetical protein
MVEVATVDDREVEYSKVFKEIERSATISETLPACCCTMALVLGTGDAIFRCFALRLRDIVRLNAIFLKDSLDIGFPLTTLHTCTVVRKNEMSKTQKIDELANGRSKKRGD